MALGQPPCVCSRVQACTEVTTGGTLQLRRSQAASTTSLHKHALLGALRG